MWRFNHWNEYTWTWLTYTQYEYESSPFITISITYGVQWSVIYADSYENYRFSKSTLWQTRHCSVMISYFCSYSGYHNCIEWILSCDIFKSSTVSRRCLRNTRGWFMGRLLLKSWTIIKNRELYYESVTRTKYEIFWLLLLLLSLSLFHYIWTVILVCLQLKYITKTHVYKHDIFICTMRIKFRYLAITRS